MERFGQYELMHRLGMGGMAEVFRARTTGEAGFVKHVVIKRILPHHASNEAFIKMFMDEARLAAKLTHANIVQVFDFQQQDGTFYIAMELVEGVGLDHIMRRAIEQGKPIGLNRAVQIAICMCRGLGYAHERMDNGAPMGIVHRDVSPQNVLVSFLGEVKVADFGIAKAAVRATHTETGFVKGKKAYMAPEHAQGEPLDARADIFATGIVLWEMLAQRRMYDADNEMQLLRRVMLAEIPDIHSYVPDLPPSLSAALAKLLAPNPDDRFATMRQATKALEAVLHELGGAMAAPLDEYLSEIIAPELRAAISAPDEGEVTNPERRQTKVLDASKSHETLPLVSAVSVAEPTLTAPVVSAAPPTAITQPSKRSGSRVLIIVAVLLAAGATAWLVTRPAPEVHQVIAVSEPALLQPASIAVVQPLEETPKPAAEDKTPETAKAKPAPKKELGVMLFSCPVGSRVLDRGALAGTLTERNRSRFTLPVGTHLISVRTPDGKLTKARTVTVSKEFSDQFDCD